MENSHLKKCGTCNYGDKDCNHSDKDRMIEATWTTADYAAAIMDYGYDLEDKCRYWCDAVEYDPNSTIPGLFKDDACRMFIYRD